MPSVSIISVQFKIGKNEDSALQDVKDKVDLVLNKIPADADKPIVKKLDMNSMRPVMNIVMEGNMSPTELYTLADKTVKERISQVNGIGRVDIVGGEEREIRVAFDKGPVFENNLSLLQIGQILAAANVEMPGGSFKQPGQDLSVNMKGEFDSMESIENLDIPTASGIRKLRQIADVQDSGKTVKMRTTLFEKAADERSDNTLLLQVIKTPSGNTVKAVREVQKRLPGIVEDLGGRISLKVITEDATFIQGTVSDTLSNIYQGILLTGLVLLFFLHDFRSTFIIAMSMPFSIIATFMVMKMMGISLNMLSMMGLSTATGVLVANSVVVLENIFRYKELGHDRKDSAAKGTSEVVVAVLASTLTNIAVFVPLGSVSGIMGMMMRDFAYTTVIATVFSILVSLTLTPMLAALILPESAKKELRISRKLEAVFKGWEVWYRGTLEFLLKNKRRSLAVVGVTALAFLGSMSLARFIHLEMSPVIDGGNIDIAVELPQGYDLEASAVTLLEIENRVKEYPEVVTIVTTLGQIDTLNQDVSMSKMQVRLVDKGLRKRSNQVIAADMTRKLSDIPAARIRVEAVSQFNSGQAPISMRLLGPDIAVLEDYAARISDRMKATPGFLNVNTSSRKGKPEITLRPDRKKVTEEGISIQTVALSIRAAVEGLVATRYKEEGNEYDVRVVLKENALLTYDDLKNIPVATAKGTRPVSYFTDIGFTDGVSKIMHADKVKTIEITSALLPGYTQGDLTAALNRIVKEVGLPKGYSTGWGFTSKAFAESIRDMLIVFAISILLTYMLLAATLEGFAQPLLMMITIPLALIGVVAAILLTGVPLSISGMLGVVMLVGIVVNNAILMLDYANQLRALGKNAKESLVEACPTKLKPILMSNIAIGLGMLPMALGIGASGAEMRTNMGIVSIGGIVSSTVFTLWVIPAMDYLVHRTKARIARGRNESAGVPTPEARA